MHRSILLAIAIATNLTATGAIIGQNANTENLTRQSRYIFRGRVEKVAASNLKALTATANTAVVLVEDVLYAPPTLNDFTRQRITVQLVNPASSKPGQVAVFFTNGWLYGETLAVIEVAHLTGQSDSGELRKQIADVHRRMDD